MTKKEAFDLCARKLARKDLFFSELCSELTKSGCPPSTAEDVLQELRSKRILDDKRLVEDCVRALAAKKLGPELIRQKLLARGAPEDLLDESLCATAEEPNALDLLRKKAPADRAKAGRLLFSKGYSEDAVEAALSEFFGDE